MTEEKEYRCTRNGCYSAVGCGGHGSVKTRQGHYVKAKSVMDAAMKMFIDYPYEAVSGFTIQPKENEGALFTWTIFSGLEHVVVAERVGLPDLYVRMGEWGKRRDPFGLIAGLHGSIPDENKITLALHHHRHGVDALLYRASRELNEEEVIAQLDNFEPDRSDEYIEMRGSSSVKDILVVEV